MGIVWYCKYKYLTNSLFNFKTLIMETIQAIKPGPKPKTDEGKDDKRRRVNPENQPKHPDLKPHKHEPND